MNKKNHKRKMLIQLQLWQHRNGIEEPYTNKYNYNTKTDKNEKISQTNNDRKNKTQHLSGKTQI